MAFLKTRIQAPKAEVNVAEAPSTPTAPAGPLTLEGLRNNVQYDVVYTVPVDWIDWEDKTFFTRENEEAVLQDEETDQLRDSLASIGQQVPAIFMFNEAGKIQLADGWRRSLSIRRMIVEAKAKGATAPASGVKGQFVKLTPKEAIGLTTTVNFNRKDHTGYQKVVQIGKMMAPPFGYSADEVADTTGLNKSWVFRLLYILKPENNLLLDALKANKITLSEAVTVARRTEGMIPEKKAHEVAKLEKAILEVEAATEGKDGEEGKDRADSGAKARPKKKGGIGSYFIEDPASGRFSFAAKVNPKSANPVEVAAMIDQTTQFLSALRVVKKKLSSKKGGK
jgi:hypothetical protein